MLPARVLSLAQWAHGCACSQRAGKSEGLAGLFTRSIKNISSPSSSGQDRVQSVPAGNCAFSPLQPSAPSATASPAAVHEDRKQRGSSSASSPAAHDSGAASCSVAHTSQALNSISTPTPPMRPLSRTTADAAGPSEHRGLHTGAGLAAEAQPRSLPILLRELMTPRASSWVPSVSWGVPTIAAVTAIGCGELLLLPGVHGTCAGTLVAESMFSAAGQCSSLASLLAASDGLEAVQAFSLARKLGQFALLDMIIRVVTGNKPCNLFRLDVSQPLDRERGWYRWACVGLLAMGTMTALHHGCMALLSTAVDTTQVAGQLTSSRLDWFTGGDQRTLPYHCRWWAETVVLAPLLEETLFRGFLLASLTKYLPVGGALFVSSGAFALCHLGSCGVSELPLLMGMGAVLGALYLRTGNLMAPVAAHAFHNACAMIAA